MNEFLQMGGYAGFVWSAYGVTALVMVAMLVVSLRGLRRQQQAVRLLEEARGRSRASTDPQPAEPVSARSPGVTS